MVREGEEGIKHRVTEISEGDVVELFFRRLFYISVKAVVHMQARVAQAFSLLLSVLFRKKKNKTCLALEPRGCSISKHFQDDTKQRLTVDHIKTVGSVANRGLP